MKGKLWLVIGLAALCVLLSTQQDNQARAQQGQDREPGPDRQFNLTSYQGLEQTPRLKGGEPAPENLSPDAPTVNVPWSQIVFQSFRNENDWNIFLTDSNGTFQTQLTSDASSDVHPRLNRGCTRIAFASKRSGNYEIYTMNPDGSGLAQLTQNDKDDVYPAWSYDGSLIAFQSYRDGNPEIYIMNADGSNQRRLTDSPGYDQMPAWSPDGRIAFSSDRGGGFGIWMMNSDGSGLTLLANQPYSMYPAWSPDGNQIAYSADNDGDGWMEMWLTNVDGTNQHQLLDLGGIKDAWVRSWSPDGQYIAYTEISFIEYQGNWYWTTAYLYARDLQFNGSTPIIGNNTEWHPDWEPTEALLPVSQMSQLPAVSPASFTVSWSGYDQGPSGLKDFDFQVKDGASGTWTSLMIATTATSDVYTGVGGHTYYFRTRAHDIAGNYESWPPDYDVFTTVESLPPVTSINQLPAYLRNGGFVQWSGTDPGGSGIKYYDVQYRDIALGTWIAWLTSTTDTGANFNGTSGHTYQFRVRATDKAQNVEPWHPANWNPSATIYLWAVQGLAEDNTGMPVTDMMISTQPGAYESDQSDREGNYTAYVVSNSNSYTATWDKTGYGDLPATTFGNKSDATVDVVMPPSDNIIQNWGFEDGPFTTAWKTNGVITPTLSSEQHTGDYAALLGNSYNFLPNEPMILTNMFSSNTRSEMAVDTNGGVHVVWSEIDGSVSRVYYARRNPDGHWATLRQEISGPDGGTSPQIAVDPDQTAHVVWAINDDIQYASRNLGGVWSIPIFLTTDTTPESEPLIRVGPENIIHVLWWRGNRNLMYALTYKQKANGVWSEPYIIPLGEHLNEGRLQFIVGTDNVVHVFYGSSKCQYTQRKPDGTWTTLERFPTFMNCSVTSDLVLSVDHTGGVYALWLMYNSTDYSLNYSKRGNFGWPDPEIIAQGEVGAIALSLDSENTPHITWCQDDIYYYSHRTYNNSWRAPESIPGITCDYNNWTSNIILQVDDHNTIHLAWAFSDINYMTREFGETWTVRWEYGSGGLYGLKLVIDEDYKIHMMWNSAWQVFYAGPPSAEQTGDSTITRAIHVPITLTSPTLSFLYYIGGWSPPALSSFDVQLNNGISTSALISTSEVSNSWQHAWFDLSPWLSQTITITFHVHQAEGYYPLWAYLDEITVGSAHPDVWVSVSGGRAALPGNQVTLQLTFGNRSPAAEALSSTITATLPAGLIFASASLTPTVNGNVLTWSMGDLPPGSGPTTIWITATVAGDVELGSTLTLPVEIATLTPELEQANNQDEYALFIGRRMYLPLTQR